MVNETVGILTGLNASWVEKGREGAHLTEGDVHYTLQLSENTFPLHDLVGQPIRLEFTGNIACQGCGKPIKKVFQAGYCFLCSTRLARCDLCIVKPERCHFHLGTCREPAWGEAHCMQDHVVYLANSSGLKVGITRVKNIPTRWMDQGAIQALPFLRVSSRRLAGLVEVEFAQHIPDKTNWRAMLKNDVVPMDLTEKLAALRPVFEPIVEQVSALGLGALTWIDSPPTYHFTYPVQTYPTTITSLSFDKTPVIEGRLEGIKGQYLLLDAGVLNLGKFEGYELRLRLPLPH